jgi:hypothetical protein
MPGKSKDNKANKGRKALENEWQLAVSAAENGDRYIYTNSKNLPSIPTSYIPHHFLILE